LLAFFIETLKKEGVDFGDKKGKATYDRLGRPTKMTEETLKKLEQAYKFGCNKTEACEFAEISFDTLNDFEHKHPEFLQLMDAWKDNNVIISRAIISKKLATEQNESTAWAYLRAKRKSEFAEQHNVAQAGVVTIEDLEAAAEGIEIDETIVEE